MNNNRELITQEDLSVSTIIIKPLIYTARYNPVISSFWIAGILILFFFQGFKVSPEIENRYQKDLNNIDFNSLINIEDKYFMSRSKYENSRGWFFSCDNRCTRLKKIYEEDEKEYLEIKKKIDIELSKAKKNVGVFSYILLLINY
jgi:hypothetical protein